MAKHAKTEKDIVREDHERLQNKVQDIEYKRNSIIKGLATPIFMPILARWEDDIERRKDHLVDAESKNVVKLQAEIHARRDLIQALRDSYMVDLVEAQEELAAFERENALLLAADKAESDGDESEKASKVG